MSDLYSASSVFNTVVPATVSGTTATGTAIATAAFDGVINIITNSSALTTGTITTVPQYSGASGWADVTGGTVTIVSGASTTLTSETPVDSRLGDFVRAKVTHAGPENPIVSSVVLAPKKDTRAA